MMTVLYSLACQVFQGIAQWVSLAQIPFHSQQERLASCTLILGVK